MYLDTAMHHDPAMPDDSALARLARRGGGEGVAAFEALDRRYRGRLIHLLRPRVATEADAEDLAQQALYKAYQNLHRYDPARRWSTWLFTIALRLTVDHHRRGAAQPPAGGPVGAAERVDDTPGPLEAAIAREDADNLWSLAESVLTPGQWTAMWLHYGEGLTPAEVAAATRKTGVQVRVTLHRGRRRLAEALRPGDAPDPATRRVPCPSPFADRSPAPLRAVRPRLGVAGEGGRCAS